MTSMYLSLFDMAEFLLKVFILKFTMIVTQSGPNVTRYDESLTTMIATLIMSEMRTLLLSILLKILTEIIPSLLYGSVRSGDNLEYQN